MFHIDRNHNKFIRVSRCNLCPICYREKGCGYFGRVVVCVRVPSSKVAKNGAWIHILDDPIRSNVRAVTINKVCRHDVIELTKRFQAAINPARLQRLSAELGLSIPTLRRFGIGWVWKDELRRLGTKCRSDGCWTFPMRDAQRRIVGVRLRTPDGFKFSIAGGNSGLFVPDNIDISRGLIVCEGVTDACAVADIGFVAVGRSSATRDISLLVELVRLHDLSRVVIIADGDDSGQGGAITLASSLQRYTAVRVITPPAGIKDARAWTQTGLTRDELSGLINAPPIT